jgi:hypothetical protein
LWLINVFKMQYGASYTVFKRSVYFSSWSTKSRDAGLLAASCLPLGGSWESLGDTWDPLGAS